MAVSDAERHGTDGGGGKCDGRHYQSRRERGELRSRCGLERSKWQRDHGGQRGGSFSGNEDILRASYRNFDVFPSIEFASVGFRVASVPEPSGLVLTILASGMMFARRKR